MTPCVEWPLSRDSDGYAVIKNGGAYYRVHRLFYALKHGPIGAGMVVRHTCDNRGCVNEAHWVLGTHAENMADMKAKDRHARGERMPTAKLTDAAVRAIRSSGKTCKELAALYGCAISTVHSARCGQTWRHLQ